MVRIAHRAGGKNSAALDGNVGEFPWTLLPSNSVGRWWSPGELSTPWAGRCLRRSPSSGYASSDALLGQVGAFDGLRVFGDPTGPLFAVAQDDNVPADRRVDPHRWADSLRARGWHAQLQPGFRRADGSRMPRT